MLDKQRGIKSKDMIHHAPLPPGPFSVWLGLPASAPCFCCGFPAVVYICSPVQASGPSTIHCAAKIGLHSTADLVPSFLCPYHPKQQHLSASNKTFPHLHPAMKSHCSTHVEQPISQLNTASQQAPEPAVLRRRIMSALGC